MDQGVSSCQPKIDAFDLREIIDGGCVEPHFQPIVSLNRRSIVAVEGLSRGFYPGTSRLIPPTELFHQAMIQGLQLDLDQLCRGKILHDFNHVQAESPEFLLTLNLDASIFSQGVSASGYLRQQAAEAGLRPEQIALEIIESDVEDVKELQRFVEMYRGYGFLIALDDVGAGYSNLNRIPLIKPDILKIDRYLVQDIQGDFYKQEVLRSAVKMARRLGSLIIAEGVETQEEALALLDMDVDLIQGYFFARPQPRAQLERQKVMDRIGELGKIYKRSFLNRMGVRKFNRSRFYAILMEIQMELGQKNPIQFDKTLGKVIERFPLVEGAYILEEGGIQVSEYFFNQGHDRRPSVVFRSSPKGSDHTMKDYFYFLMDPSSSKSTYVTEPHLSMATGNSCVTISSFFESADKGRYILCLEVNTESLSEETKP
ncbi:MAG TPA: EAL domain-containing protein [bacterium]|nr:EAL domain-containing protein [bacterium]